MSGDFSERAKRVAGSNPYETSVDPSGPIDGYVLANGVKLHYLKWGSPAPVVIMIPGLGENPHVFDDFAPSLTDHFRVISYARRGTGRSMASPPYDTGTLTKDLIDLMDALHIDKADLIGWSMGGNEVTAATADYPERVGRIVYFDSYDGTDAADTYRLRPKGLSVPDTALASLEAYCDYVGRVHYPGLERSRIEVALRENVVVRGDGSVSLRMRPEATEAQERTWLTERRPYARAHAPALAIFAASLPDLSTSDPEERRVYIAARQRLQAASIARLERELTGARTVVVPGNHKSFWLESRSIVAAAVREHLLAQHA